MVRTIDCLANRAIAASLCGAMLVACQTAPPPKPVAPSTQSPPLRTEPAPASVPVVPVAPAAETQPSAVAARFPEPSTTYRTPALQDNRAGFTTNAELQTQLQRIARDGSSTTTLLTLGASQRGAPLQALLFSRQADRTAAALLASGKPTVLLIGQQHGDEPASSEALIVLAQELASGRLKDLLERINVVMLARANPDGAERGQHVSANGVDIDQDHLVLSTPEAQAIARLVQELQPAVVIDAHEYEVSPIYLQKFNALQRDDAFIQYASTGNLNSFITKAAEEWFREPLVARLKQQGLTWQWSYTTSADAADKTLSMGSTRPDSARNANGLRNAISFVIESRGAGLGRMHLKRRVHTHVTAISSLLQSTADRSAALLKLRPYVDAELSAQACQGRVVIEAALTPSEYTVAMLDPSTGADIPFTVNWNSALVLREATVRNRPCGYWLAADQSDAVAKLRGLGVRVERAVAVGVVQGEAYSSAAAAGNGARTEVQVLPTLLDVPLGSFYVPLSQPLANLAVAAMEPDTASSFVANGIIGNVNKQARVTALPGMKLVVMP